MLSAIREAVVIALQSCQVLFLALHDWVPLGTLNDVAAVGRQDTRSRLVIVTLVQTLPFAYGLMQSVRQFGQPCSVGLMRWLLISYGVLLVGQLRAWWWPYLFRAEPQRAERYKAMFSRTHSFLPERNGIGPNTAHILLHLATFTTLCVLMVP